MKLSKTDSATKAKVLILDGHSKASAESVLSLPKWCEIHVAAADADCLSFASRRVVQRLVQPASPEALREWLENHDRSEQYDLIIPSTEASLLALMSDEVDPALRAKAVIAPEQSIDIALDKQRTLETARQLGIKIPRSTVVTSMDRLPEPAFYPVAIKPAHSKVTAHGNTLSLFVSICTTAEERLATYSELLPYTAVVEQEYFRGRGVGVEVLFENGELRWLFVHERIHELPVTGGASTYRRAIDAPDEVKRAAVNLMTHLRWHGVAMVEFKVAEDGDYRLMEINPRLWGSLPLAVAAGVNFPLGLLKLALGESPGDQPRYRRGLYVRDIQKDLHWFEQSWRQRHNPLLIRPLCAQDFFALGRPLLRLERWDLFRWREPELWWSQTKVIFSGLRSRGRRFTAKRTAHVNWKKMEGAWRNQQIKRVLVLCYGNICRSPVVEKMLQTSVADIEIVSAGFHAQSQRTTPVDWAAAVEQTLGMDLRNHRSRVVDKDTVKWADLIIVMDTRNWFSLAETYPAAMAKTILLGVTDANAKPHSLEIPDPYGQDQSMMKSIAVLLQRCTDQMARQRHSRT